MTIRPYRSSDEVEVIQLWNDCGLVVPWNDPVKDIRRKAGHSPDGFLVGEENGIVIATCMAGYDGHRGWLNYLTVAPARQGAGLGRRIVERAEEYLRAAGCPKINLQIRTSNLGTIAFYRELGYEEDSVVSLGKRLELDDETSSFHS